VIFDTFGAMSGFAAIPRAPKLPQAVLDIFFCYDLYFFTMVGWDNRSENAPSASAAEKEIIIPQRLAVQVPELPPLVKFPLMLFWELNFPVKSWLLPDQWTFAPLTS
jgi:hypothetical protein